MKRVSGVTNIHLLCRQNDHIVDVTLISKGGQVDQPPGDHNTDNNMSKGPNGQFQ